MEEVDKGCPMIRIGVSGLMFLLVPAYQGSAEARAVCVCVCVCVCVQYRICGKKLPRQNQLDSLSRFNTDL